MDEAVKIYILPVSEEFQPDRQNFMSSPLQEYGVEQDFLWWLQRSEYVTDDQKEADWDYLPLFWNRCYINFNWGQERLDDIQAEPVRLVSRDRRAFTVCEYDLHSFYPDWDLCGMTVFTASRRAEGTGIDVPLLCAAHRCGAPLSERRVLASFVGNLNTHSPRPEMAGALKGRQDCHVEHGDRGLVYFEGLMRDSYLALCPRGYGGQSFRFYEAMQIGVAPLLIGDLDTRPFKRWLPWDRVSLYRPGAEGLSEFLDGLDCQELVNVGKRAQNMYERCLAFGQWPRYVLKELEHAG